MNFNKVFIGGHITRDIEFKELNSGMSLCNFGVAVNEKYKDEEKTHFFEVTAFSKTAETINKYLSKGSSIFIEGRLNLDQWETEEGERRSRVKVICDRFQFVGSSDKDSSDKQENKTKQPKKEKSESNFDDEAPF